MIPNNPLRRPAISLGGRSGILHFGGGWYPFDSHETFDVLSRPSFLLFRADLSENINGCRWLLLAWLPDVAPEVERARWGEGKGGGRGSFL